MPTNSTVGTAGRFCNHFFRNIAASILAEKANLTFNYSYKDELATLGIRLFNGNKTYAETAIMNDDTFYTAITDPHFDANLFLDWTSAQTPEFSTYLYDYFKDPCRRGPVLCANFYRARYNTNNDVFVHVRLGDAVQWSPGADYFDAALSKLTFEQGYISTDQKDHPIVKHLMEKWGLTLFERSEVETIMFANTCKHLVLSHGTFSYVIGLLGFYSDIYCPPDRYNTWCGKIFDLPGWTKLEFENT